MLIVAAPQPSKVVDAFLQVNESDPWLRRLHAQLVKQQRLTEAEFVEFGALFDEKKLRQMLHWELRFLNALCVVETPFVYPLMIDIGTKDLFYKKDQV